MSVPTSTGLPLVTHTTIHMSLLGQAQELQDKWLPSGAVCQGTGSAPHRLKPNPPRGTPFASHNCIATRQWTISYSPIKGCLLYCKAGLRRSSRAPESEVLLRRLIQRRRLIFLSPIRFSTDSLPSAWPDSAGPTPHPHTLLVAPARQKGGPGRHLAENPANLRLGVGRET